MLFSAPVTWHQAGLQPILPHVGLIADGRQLSIAHDGQPENFRILQCVFENPRLLQRKAVVLVARFLGRILRVGVPVAMQDGLIQISFLIITVIANRRGLTDAAAVGVVEKFISFVFLVPSSMLSTVSAR